VLPVITGAVNDLTAALRGAVQDGTVGKFGEALAAGFQSGIKWAKDFLAQVNFTQISADLRAFADKTGEVFSKIGEYASTAGNTVKLVYGVMSAGTNVVLGGVYLIGEAFAGVASNIQSGLALLYEGLAKITFGQLSAAYKQAAEEVKVSAGATWAAAEELGVKSQAAFEQAAQGAQLARDGFAGLSAAATGAAPAVSTSAQVVGEMAKQLEAVAQKNAAARQETEAKKAADEAAAVALRQLREEYQALVEKGDLQGAAEKLQQVNNAMRETPAASKDAIKAAQEAAQAIADAFQRLGITSSADLKLQADSAQRDYKIIKGAGTSTASDIAGAFKKSAEAAIAANNGVAPAWVTAEAAARGYEVQVDSAGKATLRAAGEAVNSVDGLASAYTRAGRAAQSAADSAVAALSLQDEAVKRSKEQEARSLNGRRDAVDASAPFLLREKERAGKLSADDLAVAEAAFQTAKNNKQSYDANWSAFSNDGAQSIFMELNSATDILQKVKALADARSAASDAGRVPDTKPTAASAAQVQSAAPPAAPLTPAPSAAPPAPAPTYITNITLDGRQRTVRVADAASSATLNDILRQLAEARGTAS
jgi:hypothetical protein